MRKRGFFDAFALRRLKFFFVGHACGFVRMKRRLGCEMLRSFVSGVDYGCIAMKFKISPFCVWVHGHERFFWK
jgi:hypothetical protein